MYIYRSICNSISVYITIYIYIITFIHGHFYRRPSGGRGRRAGAAVKIAAKGRKLCCSLTGKGGNAIKYILYESATPERSRKALLRSIGAVLTASKNPPSNNNTRYAYNNCSKSVVVLLLYTVFFR